MPKFLNGIMLPHLKSTAEIPTEKMDTPKEVAILTQHHIGVACEPLVSPGDSVKVGQKIADSSATFCVPVHSSVSGTVKSIDDFTMPSGANVKAIVIETDGEQTRDESLAPPTITDHASFIKAVRESGVVGLGGAGFPTHVKYNPANLSDIDTFIINAAECEPYITSDYKTMLDRSEDVLIGVNTIIKHLGVTRTIIAIEDDKPKAIEKMSEIFRQNDTVEVMKLPKSYPQGAEKVLIYNAIGTTIPEGKLPADVGVLVSNITTVQALGRYFRSGTPRISTTVTVEGGCVKSPKNLTVCIGTRIKDVLEAAGGCSEPPEKVLMGGPMMGVAVNHLDFPMLKNNNAILALKRNETTYYAETPCIRCGDCVKACPINLMPFLMKSATTNHNLEELEKLKINLCIECGCCSYVCPAKQELVQSHKIGKKSLKNASTNK